MPVPRMSSRLAPHSEIRLAGAVLHADPSGALLWPAERTLIVADLHFEKGSGFAARGVLLPPYDTRATLDRLEAVLRRVRPRRVVCLGDSFHDRRAADRLAADDAARLARMAAAHEWIWVAGNHDPAPPVAGGAVVDELMLGPLTLRHAAAADPAAGEVSGHYHPKASVTVRARRVTGRCFAADARRLILPAFGAYAGGLDVLDPAIAGLFPGGCDVHFLGRERVTRLPRERLLHV